MTNMEFIKKHKKPIIVSGVILLIIVVIAIGIDIYVGIKKNKARTLTTTTPVTSGSGIPDFKLIPPITRKHEYSLNDFSIQGSKSIEDNIINTNTREKEYELSNWSGFGPNSSYDELPGINLDRNRNDTNRIESFTSSLANNHINQAANKFITSTTFDSRYADELAANDVYVQPEFRAENLSSSMAANGIVINDRYGRNIDQTSSNITPDSRSVAFSLPMDK